MASFHPKNRTLYFKYNCISNLQKRKAENRDTYVPKSGQTIRRGCCYSKLWIMPTETLTLWCTNFFWQSLGNKAQMTLGSTYLLHRNDEEFSRHVRMTCQDLLWFRWTCRNEHLEVQGQLWFGSCLPFSEVRENQVLLCLVDLCDVLFLHLVIQPSMCQTIKFP